METDMETKVHKTRIADVSHKEPGIIIIKYHETVNINRDDAIELMDTLSSISPTPCPRIHLYNPEVSYEFEAIEEFSKSKLSKAVAIVFDTPKSKTILNSIHDSFLSLGFNFPVEFFNNMDGAVQWSKKFCYE